MVTLLVCVALGGGSHSFELVYKFNLLHFRKYPCKGHMSRGQGSGVHDHYVDGNKQDLAMGP